MSGLKGKYYWVRTSEGVEIGHQRDSGNWSLCGIDTGEDINSEILEVIGEVKANEPTTSDEPALNIDLVIKSYSEKNMDDAYDKGYNDGASAAATDIMNSL